MSADHFALYAAVATDIGHLRHRNEDHAVLGRGVVGGPRASIADTLTSPFLVAVADGLGGHPAGHVASGLVAQLLASEPPPTDAGQVERLVDKLQAAVHERMAEDVGLTLMGTTLVAAAVTDTGQALVVNVGDSPGFVIADGILTEVTVEDRGPYGEITQCLGGSEAPMHLSPHITAVHGGGRLLLCSDGLTDVVPQHAVAATLDRGEAAQAAERLVALALDGGGPDNVTVAVIDLLPLPTPPTAA